eukprot:ANDGO_06167.mRNA.1 Polynucleotide 5'-hydroxyl-kinase NOL9
MKTRSREKRSEKRSENRKREDVSAPPPSPPLLLSLKPGKLEDGPEWDNELHILTLSSPNAQLAYCGLLKFRLLEGSVEIQGVTISERNASFVSFVAPHHGWFLLRVAIHKSNHAKLLLSYHHTSTCKSRFPRRPLPEYCELPLHGTFSSDFPSLRLVNPKSAGCAISTLRDVDECDVRDLVQVRTRLNSLVVNHAPGRVSQKIAPVIMVMGRRAVGKSTYTRQLVNSLLMSRLHQDQEKPAQMARVVVLDCDPGQPFVSGRVGCVTLSVISRPILHSVPLLDAYCAEDVASEHYSLFYGCLAPDVDPLRFMALVKALFQRYVDRYASNPSSKSWTPLVVHLSGFLRGIGVEMAAEMCQLMMPDHIVHISPSPAADYPIQVPLQPIGVFTREVVWSLERDAADAQRVRVHHVAAWKRPVDGPVSMDGGSAVQENETGLGDPDEMNSLVNLPAEDSKKKPSTGRMDAGSQRLCILASYFRSLYLADSCDSLPDAASMDLAEVFCRAAPYCISRVAIRNLGSHVLTNGQIVGLLDRHDACLGLGILRSISVTNDLLFILTPLDQAQVSECTAVAASTEMSIPVQFMRSLDEAISAADSVDQPVFEPPFSSKFCVTGALYGSTIMTGGLRPSGAIDRQSGGKASSRKRLLPDTS